MSYSDDEVQWPYCGHEQGDSWELGRGGEGDGETECGECFKTFRWSRTLSVSYESTPIVGPHPLTSTEQRWDAENFPHGVPADVDD